MSRTIWLASYPKSGNTWTRSLISYALDPDTHSINTLSGTRGIASAALPFDNQTLLASSLLHLDEIEALRPDVHRALSISTDFEESMDEDFDKSPFQKVHDAYTYTASGHPLLGGAEVAKLAILIMRDPRAVAPSLANHLGTTIDYAIERMADPDFQFAPRHRNANIQLPQRLLTWGGFFDSWMNQTDIPVHLIRYEDLSTQPAETLMGLMTAAGCPINRDTAQNAVERADFSRLSAQEASEGFREAPRGRTFFRKGKSDAWREELTQAQIQSIEITHGTTMRQLGYATVDQDPINRP